MRSRGVAAWRTAITASLLVFGCAACLPEDDPSATSSANAETSGTATTPIGDAPDGDDDTSGDTELLFVRDLKDGDSWVASDGKEYRLGLVNAPERNEPCGSQARAFTSEYLDEGFTVDVYSSDRYGRSVVEAFDAQGNSLNVALAKSGYGNDKFLKQFRHENTDLAERLDAAFAAAPHRDCLNSGAKAKASPSPQSLVQQPKKQAGNCHPNYSPCLKNVADLDCGEIGFPVTVIGSDPYRLDRDGDGIGCD